MRPARFPVLLTNPAGSLQAQTDVDISSTATPDNLTCPVRPVAGKVYIALEVGRPLEESLSGNLWITAASTWQLRPLRSDLPASRSPDPRRLPSPSIDPEYINSWVDSNIWSPF